MPQTVVVWSRGNDVDTNDHTMHAHGVLRVTGCHEPPPQSLQMAQQRSIWMDVAPDYVPPTQGQYVFWVVEFFHCFEKVAIAKEDFASSKVMPLAKPSDAGWEKLGGIVANGTAVDAWVGDRRALFQVPKQMLVLLREAPGRMASLAADAQQQRSHDY